MTTEEKIGLIKFDGSDASWHVWSLKTLALAKAKGFKQSYVKDTKPCSDAVYETSKDADEKKIYERNDKAYQLLVMSCDGMAFGLVNKAKTKDLMDGNAFLAWKNLNERYAPTPPLILFSCWESSTSVLWMALLPIQTNGSSSLIY